VEPVSAQERLMNSPYPKNKFRSQLYRMFHDFKA